MMTLFDLIQVLALLIGVYFGATQGYQSGNVLGLFVGALIGLLAGWVIGRLPFLVAMIWARADLKRASTEKLQSRLAREYFSSHLIIAELLQRGEPITSFSEYANELAQSKDTNKARFGKNLLTIWPELIINGRETQQ
jgi:membrane protein YqaA with SNARE-associated domain